MISFAFLLVDGFIKKTLWLASKREESFLTRNSAKAAPREVFAGSISVFICISFLERRRYGFSYESTKPICRFLLVAEKMREALTETNTLLTFVTVQHMIAYSR